MQHGQHTHCRRVVKVSSCVHTVLQPNILSQSANCFPLRLFALHVLHVVFNVSTPRQQLKHTHGYATTWAATCVSEVSAFRHCEHRGAYVWSRRSFVCMPVVSTACT